MKDWVQPFAPGMGGWPAGHQIGSLVEIASAAAWVASGWTSPCSSSTVTAVFSGTSLSKPASDLEAASSSAGADFSVAASPSTGTASSVGCTSPVSSVAASSSVGWAFCVACGSAVSSVDVLPSLEVPSSLVVSAEGVSVDVPSSAWTVKGLTALKTKTAMIANERKDVLALSDMDPP